MEQVLVAKTPSKHNSFFASITTTLSGTSGLQRLKGWTERITYLIKPEREDIIAIFDSRRPVTFSVSFLVNGKLLSLETCYSETALSIELANIKGPARPVFGHPHWGDSKELNTEITRTILLDLQGRGFKKALNLGTMLPCGDVKRSASLAKVLQKLH